MRLSLAFGFLALAATVVAGCGAEHPRHAAQAHPNSAKRLIAVRSCVGKTFTIPNTPRERKLYAIMKRASARVEADLLGATNAQLLRLARSRRFLRDDAAALAAKDAYNAPYNATLARCEGASASPAPDQSSSVDSGNGSQSPSVAGLTTKYCVAAVQWSNSPPGRPSTATISSC